MEFTLSGLTNNTEYEAQASLDHSFPADTTRSTTFTTTETTVSPVTPAIMEVSSGDGELTVLWTAPDGLEVTGYDLRYISVDEDYEEDENWTVLLNVQDTATPPEVVDECVTDSGHADAPTYRNPANGPMTASPRIAVAAMPATTPSRLTSQRRCR